MDGTCVVSECTRATKIQGRYFCDHHRANAREIGQLRDDNKKLRARVAVLETLASSARVAVCGHPDAARITELEDALMNAGLPF
jgi:hypothetical protein